MCASIGYPSVKDYNWFIQRHQIKVCPVTLQDIDVAPNIWSNSFPYLKVKTTRKKPIPVAVNLVQVLEDLVKIHKDIYLTADLLFVNGIPLFITIIRNILFTAFNHLYNRKVETIFKSFKYIYSYYMKRGFQITTIHIDGEFAPLHDMVYEHMPGVNRINATSANEHVPDIERRVGVIKDRTRAFRHSLPFNNILKLLTVYIISTVVRMLNYFTVKGGISDILSPKTIIYGETLHYN